MAAMMIRHRVRDFDQWKPIYEQHRPARQAAGLKDLHLWRNADDPNDVVILFATQDVAKAKSFAASPDLKDRMKAAGVEGTPTILLLEEAR